jgi:hypothetical protein
MITNACMRWEKYESNADKTKIFVSILKATFSDKYDTIFDINFKNKVELDIKKKSFKNSSE